MRLAQRIAIERQSRLPRQFPRPRRRRRDRQRAAALSSRADGAATSDCDGGAIVYLRGSQEEMWHKLLQLQFAPNPRRGARVDAGAGRRRDPRGLWRQHRDGRTAANRGAVALSRWTNHLRAAVRAADGHDRLISVLRRAAYTADRALLFVNAGIDPQPAPRQRRAISSGGADSTSTPSRRRTMASPGSSAARIRSVAASSSTMPWPRSTADAASADR